MVSHSNNYDVGNEKSRILFIVDASQSMLGRWQSGRKIDIARNLLSGIHAQFLKCIKEKILF